MDHEAAFLDLNKHIPTWILNASVLIDKKSRIKMVTPPWVTEDMTKLFYEIVSMGEKRGCNIPLKCKHN